MVEEYNVMTAAEMRAVTEENVDINVFIEKINTKMLEEARKGESSLEISLKINEKQIRDLIKFFTGLGFEVMDEGEDPLFKRKKRLIFMW